MSNSVSSLVEALANAEEEKREVISTEDLLYNTKEHNEEVRRMRREYKERKIRKLQCRVHHPTERVNSSEEVTCRAPEDESEDDKEEEEAAEREETRGLLE